MEQHDVESAELAGAQPLELGRRGAGLEQVRLLHERADDERLAPCFELLADPVVGPGPLALGRADVRPDRLAAARKLAQHREVEVAVARQRERPRDRRGRHVESVWRAVGARLGVQCGPLPDPEPVLFVDDGDRQPGKADGLLDQRVGADDQRQLTGRELREQIGAPARRRRPGEEADRHELPGQQ